MENRWREWTAAAVLPTRMADGILACSDAACANCFPVRYLGKFGHATYRARDTFLIAFGKSAAKARTLESRLPSAVVSALTRRAMRPVALLAIACTRPRQAAIFPRFRIWVSPGLCPADVEILLGIWEYGHMKTTLELPDGLMQRVRLRAVNRNQKLKDAIAQLLELGMAASPDAGKSPRAPKPVRLKSGRVNIGDIEAAIAAGRE